MNQMKNEHIMTWRGLLFILTSFLLLEGVLWAGEGPNSKGNNTQEQLVIEWRKERDIFFRTHQRSPLAPEEKKQFKGLKYFPFDSKYVFSGKIKRTILNINNPEYYATFLTNKGTNKRYVRYGKFQFQIEGKECSLEIFKSILSDRLFVPFRDRTNGKETYEGGRYIDAEILEGYQMVLDFNMAYQPACVYNEKFVCVLPPRENTLTVEIRVGEKNLKQ